MQNKKYFLILLSSLALFFVKCDNDNTIYNVELKVNLMLNNETINVGDSILIDNKKALFQTANIYFSNFNFINDSLNEDVTVSDVFLYRIGETEKVNFNSELSKINAINFNIGVSESLNLSDPTKYDADDALGINNSDQHWNWDIGYIFFKFEGLFDVDGNNELTSDDFFAYHIGKNENYFEVNLSKTATFLKNENNQIEINIDVEELFKNVTVVDDLSSHSESSKSNITDKIISNLQNAFQ